MIAKEKGFIVDIDGFKKEFEAHQDLSRQASEQKFKGGLGGITDIHRKYHTATHLLQAALRKVLGEHVGQKGSNITEERLRFDFSHTDKMTEEQIKQTEDIVNDWISQKIDVKCEEMPYDTAKGKGAIGLFTDKYGETVKLYTIGDASCEICGGPHAENTGELGHFRITKEEASSAGVRRIKAVLE